MKTAIALIGLILVLLSTHLWIYARGLKDGKINYQHSHNLQLTLDSAYNYGLIDGEEIGFHNGYVKGAEDCKSNFLKLSHKQKRKWCK